MSDTEPGLQTYSFIYNIITGHQSGFCFLKLNSLTFTINLNIIYIKGSEVMTNAYNKLLNAYNYINNITNLKPQIAVVLGSGLGEFAANVEVEKIIPYSDIPDFPVSSIEGHKGCFVLGKIKNVPVILMQGRVHFYEGYSMEEVVLPIRVMGMLGVKNIILTNAAGGISDNLIPGTLMAIKDHISSFVPSSLIGENIDEIGVRFPDMSCVYDERLTDLISDIGVKNKISIPKGVYLQTTGPNYETPAEINMYKILGADAVGMSTACEAMAARHMGIKVCGISCITNKAAGISATPLSHDEVKTTANKVSENFKKVIYELILRIGEIRD